MILKEEVYKRCVDLIDEKISLLQQTLRDLTESAGNETKSTAGDKHETALATLQIDQENIGRQLKDALTQKADLNRLNIKLEALQIANGSLVKTDSGYFFLSVPLGKLTVQETHVIALSSRS